MGLGGSFGSAVNFAKEPFCSGSVELLSPSDSKSPLLLLDLELLSKVFERSA